MCLKLPKRVIEPVWRLCACHLLVPISDGSLDLHVNVLGHFRLDCLQVLKKLYVLKRKPVGLFSLIELVALEHKPPVLFFFLAEVHRMNWLPECNLSDIVLQLGEVVVKDGWFRDQVLHLVK